jgi:hypothetical protein
LWLRDGVHLLNWRSCVVGRGGAAEESHCDLCVGICEKVVLWW